MKNIKYILLICVAFAIASCEDNLDTFPTDQAGGAELFSDVDKAMSTINGLYRAMYVTEWGTGWEHEQFGHISIIHTGNLMAEDMIQAEMGSGWFYYDYMYQVKTDFTNTQGRPYSSWNFYYTLITNVNSILASKDVLQGTPSKINSLMGQAYALRAFSYFYLARFYQQSIAVGGGDLPGVPLYTEPTSIETEGVGRGTLNDVYELINADIDSAVVRLHPDAAQERVHISNLDYYSANGLKARIMLEQQKWQEAYDAAAEALKGGSSMLTGTDISGGFAFNDASKNCVLWGFEVLDDQVAGAGRAMLFGHMDASASDYYGSRARVCISNWLYNQVSDSDVRKDWWYGQLAEEDEEATGTEKSYNQFKFQFANVATGAGDYIFMRHEEMLLMQAEAKCMLKQYSEARTILEGLMEERQSDYEISELTDVNTLTVDSDNGPTTPASGSITLLDEIMLQRRIELWGEVSRIYDVKRLGTGFIRDFEGSNHSELIPNVDTENKLCPEWVMAIPQAEFDGNSSMDPITDQNPW